MDYTEARFILESLPTLEVKPGLARINRLLDALDHPERCFRAVHIAGTNGKGSVLAMLASILTRAGYKTGRFTSPELVDFRDRISVDDVWMGEGALTETVVQLLPLLEKGEAQPTLFEALTAIAFAHFSVQQVDLALVEVGLGGRFDATNVVVPLLTILTNVGRDHLDLLGDKLSQIAWEKAGIAKPGVPFLTGDLLPEAEKVAFEECRLTQAKRFRCDSITVERTAFDWERAVYAIDAGDLPQKIDLPLLGGYQQENLRVALRAVELLREAGLDISNDAIIEGLAEVRWPGRFEAIGEHPRVVLDGAHNVPAALALAEDVERYVPERQHRHLLFGALSDKEWEVISRILFPLFAAAVLTQSQSPRALPVDVLGKSASPLGIPFICSSSVSEGLSRASASLTERDVLFVTGSLTVVREARSAFMEISCRL